MLSNESKRTAFLENKNLCRDEKGFEDFLLLSEWPSTRMQNANHTLHEMRAAWLVYTFLSSLSDEVDEIRGSLLSAERAPAASPGFQSYPWEMDIGFDFVIGTLQPLLLSDEWYAKFTQGLHELRRMSFSGRFFSTWLGQEVVLRVVAEKIHTLHEDDFFCGIFAETNWLNQIEFVFQEPLHGDLDAGIAFSIAATTPEKMGLDHPRHWFSVEA